MSEFTYKTTQTHPEGNDLQEEAYRLSHKRMYLPTHTCDNMRQVGPRLDDPRWEDSMGNYGKHALEGKPSCTRCADKDMVAAGLKRMNEQLASECDRLRALVKQFKGHSHYSKPTFVCVYCERETPSENGAADDMPDACDACWNDMTEARRAEAQN